MKYLILGVLIIISAINAGAEDNNSFDIKDEWKFA
jgi:hypothetical protein